MDILFMGTPEFSLPSLGRLLQAGHFVKCVYTRADRPRGRGLRLSESPVKRFALERGVPIHQPEKLRDPAEWDRVRNIGADAIVVVAYGKILPQQILDIPPHGSINVHASLLPRHRGAAPVAWSLIAGDDETGVTTMQMDAGMDTGAILLQRSCPIEAGETAGELSVRLSEIGAELLVETLEKLESGDIRPIPQDEKGATMAPRIQKEDARLDWNDTAITLDRKIRAFNPVPVAFTECRGKPLRIWKAAAGDPAAAAGAGEPGTLVAIRGEAGLFACGDGSNLSVTEVQPDGGSRMSLGAFARGRGVRAGERFGGT